MKPWLKVLLTVLGVVVIVVITVFLTLKGCAGFIGDVGSDLLN